MALSKSKNDPTHPDYKKPEPEPTPVSAPAPKKEDKKDAKS